MITKSKNGLKISKEKSEDVNRMTDNVKRQRIQRPTMVDKILHRKLQIEQDEHIKTLGELRCHGRVGSSCLLAERLVLPLYVIN